MPQTPLILATGNFHKVKEFERLFAGSSFSVLSAEACGGMPKVDETGTTFAENAKLKAKALRALAPSNAWVLADDSGLEVDALDGAPGIYSARYAGAQANDRENIEKLLNALKDVPAKARIARFKCSLYVIDNKDSSFRYEESCEGSIAKTPSGEGGFGYDPVFIPDKYSKSFAELGNAVKEQISHRAKAIRAMLR